MTSETTSRAPRIERVPLGILYMVGATFMFSVSSAASKWLVVDYPPGEIMFARTAISLIVVAIFILPRTGFAVYRTQKPGSHILRALSQTASQTCIILAFSMMPFASVVAISFAAPLFATLASAFFLRERVGGARWTALIVGFLGVLIVTNPGAETFQIGALTTAQIQVLTSGQIQGLTSTQIGALTSTQIAAMRPDQVAGLSPAAARALPIVDATLSMSRRPWLMVWAIWPPLSPVVSPITTMCSTFGNWSRTASIASR